ncbi:hypothetical protein [Deinococcus frigens]|uniref:hypothetical protein n=1 Tax=Deinococcus frigens TaxID=249403 RepID=UPI000A8B3B5A|nr:hypothetical protein [Deinococcus frigens]
MSKEKPACQTPAHRAPLVLELTPPLAPALRELLRVPGPGRAVFSPPAPPPLLP